MSDDAQKVTEALREDMSDALLRHPWHGNGQPLRPDEVDEIVGVVLPAALAGLDLPARDAKARAEAWNEGFGAGVSAPANRALGLGNPTNPYRAALASAGPVEPPPHDDEALLRAVVITPTDIRLPDPVEPSPAAEEARTAPLRAGAGRDVSRSLP